MNKDKVTETEDDNIKGGKKGKKNKKLEDEVKDYEEFLKDIDEDDELRDKIDIFPELVIANSNVNIKVSVEPTIVIVDNKEDKIINTPSINQNLNNIPNSNKVEDK